MPPDDDPAELLAALDDDGVSVDDASVLADDGLDDADSLDGVLPLDPGGCCVVAQTGI